MFATHGIFSGCARQILREDKFPNLEKVLTLQCINPTSANQLSNLLTLDCGYQFPATNSK